MLGQRLVTKDFTDIFQPERGVTKSRNRDKWITNLWWSLSDGTHRTLCYTIHVCFVTEQGRINSKYYIVFMSPDKLNQIKKGISATCWRQCGRIGTLLLILAMSKNPVFLVWNSPCYTGHHRYYCSTRLMWSPSRYCPCGCTPILSP